MSLRWVTPTADGGTPAALGGVGLQVLGLQRLHVVLVDFEGGAELDGQSGQDVVPGHQEKRLAVDFLSDLETRTQWLAWWSWKPSPEFDGHLKRGAFLPDPGRQWLAPRTLLL